MAETITDDQIEIIKEFINDSRDMIEKLEPSIIALIQGTADTGSVSSSDDETQENINRLFRLFHSIKGTAGFLGFSHIIKTSHAAESLLDKMRLGTIKIEKKHVDLLCITCDFIREALDHIEVNFTDQDLKKKASLLTKQLKKIIEEPKPQKSAISSDLAKRFVEESSDLLETIESHLLEWVNATDDKVVDELFRNIHSFKGNCGFLGYPDLERLSHYMETGLDFVRSGDPIDKEKLSHTCLKLVDVLRQGVNEIGAGQEGVIVFLNDSIASLESLFPRNWKNPESKNLPHQLDDIKVSENSKDAVGKERQEEKKIKPVTDILADMGVIPDEDPKPPVKKNKPEKTPENKPLKRRDIRVDLEKLDTLIDLIGELVIIENMVVNNPDILGMELENFSKASQQMNKMVREIQEIAMTLRMLPVSGLFKRMIRLVYDLSSKCGKKIDLKLAGEETEVDKTVIELITDPLVHLIRNSVDHGIELPDERISAGKTERGTIQLEARHEENEIWILIDDDGAGLNREKILSKAIKMGLVQGNGADLSDNKVFMLIFEPGFSTKEQVTDVSGRGVGMDVVKQNLKKIKGNIKVDSTEGKKTRFTLRIPLTLAIIEGMIVRVGKSKYIIPILPIRESFKPEQKAITVNPDRQEIVKVREELLPVLRLHELHKKKPDFVNLWDGILLVLENQGQSICLFVDELIGQQQTVIKGLSDYMGNVTAVSGCTILGDGEVCLILDVGGLVAIK